MSFPHILIPEAAQVWHLSQQLEQFERLSADGQSQIQAQSLQHLFTWASEHSPFWRDRLAKANWTVLSDPWAALNELPPLTRADLQEHFDAMSCGGALPPNSCGFAHSTGSTGAPVRTLKHMPSYQLRYAAHTLRCTIWHQLDVSRIVLKYGARVKDETTPNWGAPAAWFAKTGPAVLFNSTQHDLTEMYSMLKMHRPGYIVADASVVEALVKHSLGALTEERLVLEGVLTTGSKVTDQLRRDCQSAFGARIINRYTCEEIGWMAIQCPRHNHLHVANSNVVIEIVDDSGHACPPGVPGRVLVTALHSEAMPLIRYDIGDVAEWGETCDCGIQLPVIGRIWGRQRDFVRLPTGESRYVVIFAEQFLDVAPIRDMRFRYYSNPLLRFEVVCDVPLNTNQKQALTQLVHKMIGFECPVEIDQKKSIDWGPTDKRVAFLAKDEPWLLV